jgi:hypothetical protein
MTMNRVTGPIRFAGPALKDRPHICAFFNSTEEARRILLPFITEGLEIGDKALHTIDPKKHDEHIRWLSSSGIDVDAARNKEQLEILDWTDSHLRGGRFDKEWTLAFWQKAAQDAKSKGFPLVRFVSQMEWVLETDLNLDELLEYEAKANDAWIRQDGPVNPAICVYDLRKFRGDIVMDVMRTHPLVIVGGLLQENPFFVPPDEFLNELRERRTDRNSSIAAA